jgi:hypothetical protein
MLLQLVYLFILLSFVPLFPLLFPILVLIDVVILLAVTPFLLVVDILPSMLLVSFVFVPIKTKFSFFELIIFSILCCRISLRLLVFVEKGFFDSLFFLLLDSRLGVFFLA